MCKIRPRGWNRAVILMLVVTLWLTNEDKLVKVTEYFQNNASF